MKKQLFLASFLLVLSFQGISQHSLFPSIQDVGDFDFEINTGVELLIEVDPSILPGQNDSFPEVTPVLISKSKSPTSCILGNKEC